jgi:hypothetical protein
LPAVALAPPWNVDLLVRLRAYALLDSGTDLTSWLTVEADAPGSAEQLVTPAVIATSAKCGLIHWRVHRRDLLYVSFPGSGLTLAPREAAAVVTGLADIARSFPPEALQRYGSLPTLR